MEEEARRGPKIRHARRDAIIFDARHNHGYTFSQIGAACTPQLDRRRVFQIYRRECEKRGVQPRRGHGAPVAALVIGNADEKIG